MGRPKGIRVQCQLVNIKLTSLARMSPAMKRFRKKGVRGMFSLLFEVAPP